MDKGGDRIPKHQICHGIAFSHLINSLQANPKQILGLSAGIATIFLLNLVQIEFWPVALTAKVSDKKMMKSEVVKYDNTRMTPADLPNRTMEQYIVTHVVKGDIAPVQRTPVDIRRIVKTDSRKLF